MENNKNVSEGAKCRGIGRSRRAYIKIVSTRKSGIWKIRSVRPAGPPFRLHPSTGHNTFGVQERASVARQ